LYATDGSAVTSPITVSTSYDPQGTRIASNHLGRSVVTWWNAGSSSENIRYRVIEPGGAPFGSADVAVSGSDAVGMPEIAATDTGEFCIVWRHTSGHEQSNCLNSSGLSVGGSTQLLESYTNVGMLFGQFHAIWGSQGGFIATYFSVGSYDYMGVPLSAAGAVQDQPFVITQATSNQNYAANGFGSPSDGSFIAGLAVYGPFGTGTDALRGLWRQADASGQVLGNATPVSQTHENEFYVHFIGLPGRRFMALWVVEVTSSNSWRLKARVFNANGTAASDAFFVMPPESDRHNLVVRGSVNTNGDVMIAWAHVDDSSSPSFGIKIHAAVFANLLPSP